MNDLKVLLIKLKDGIKSDRLSMVSAAMAYYALFALVPALSSIVLIYAWVSDPAQISHHMAKISAFMPQELQTVLSTQLEKLSSTASSTLGFGAITALLIALWSASKGSKAIIEALNMVYHEEDKRGFIKLNLLALGMTFSGAILMILAMGAIVVVPVVTKLFTFGVATGVITNVLSWVVLLGLFSFYLSFVYRFAPHRKIGKWKWISAGAVTAAVLFAVVSALFSWYAREFGNFNKAYGSLGAIIVVMTWLYLSSFVVLLGGEINALLEHREEEVMPHEKVHEEPTEVYGARTSQSQDHHQNLLH